MTNTATLQDRLNYIEGVVTSEKFHANQGLGNDTAYYIFDYNPDSELLVREHIANLVPRVNGYKCGFEIVVFDLYELIYMVIEDKGYTEQCNRIEEERGSEQLIKAISQMLRLTSTSSPIIQYIVDHTPEKAVVFLTGIGKSYPILRAHNILNNLQAALDTVPVVMFYPGRYTGQELQLFGTIKDDNYYRALPFPGPR